MVMLPEPWREVEEICFTPSTRGDRVLDEVHHVGLDDVGSGALVGDGDVDDREVHVGVLADAHPLEDGRRSPCSRGCRSR